jgi:UDP-2,3-diacylglucosamine hydrolase
MKTSARNQVLIVADAHLPLDDRSGGAQERAAFLALLQRHRETTGLLVLLGDIFDFWYEWRHVVPKRAVPILMEVHSMVRAGVPVHYFAGNHDFRLAGFLSEEVGIALHLDHWTTHIDGKRYYFHHGDGMAASDAAYRRLRSLFRNPVAQNLFGAVVHPDLAIELGRSTSDKGRRRHERAPEREPDPEEYRARARSILRSGQDVVAFGHSHMAEITRWEEGLYLNPGAFVEDRRFAVVQDGEPRLETFVP